MSTLAEVASILRENGDDQLEVQLELTTIAESILASINSLVEGVTSAATGSVDISAGDMIQNEIIEGVGDALTTSREETALDSQTSILTEMLKSINFLSEDIQSVYDILEERLQSPDVLGAGADLEDMEALEAERETAQSPRASTGRDSGSSGGGVFARIMKVVKKIGKFFSMVGIAIAAAIGAVFAFGDDNQIEKMIETLKNVFTTIIDALTPAFNFIKDEIIPVLIDLIPPVLEAIGFLFEKVIGPIITDVILPIVKVALDGLLAFFNFVSDAIKNPREVAAEVMFKIVDFFKDIGDFFGDMTDKVMIALGNTINSVLEGLASFVEDIPIIGESAAEGLRGMKTDMAGEAEERMSARAEASRERDRQSAQMTADRIARRGGNSTPEAAQDENYQKQQELAEKQLDAMESEEKVLEKQEEVRETKEQVLQTSTQTAAVPNVVVDAPAPAISVPVSSPIVQGPTTSESIPTAITIPEGVRVTPAGKFASFNKVTNTQGFFDTVEEAVKFKDASIEQAATMDAYAAQIFEERKKIESESINSSVTGIATREQQSGDMARVTDQNADMKASSSQSMNVVNAPNTSNVNNVSNTTQIMSSPVPPSRNRDDNYSGIVSGR